MVHAVFSGYMISSYDAEEIVKDTATSLQHLSVSLPLPLSVSTVVVEVVCEGESVALCSASVALSLSLCRMSSGRGVQRSRV